jgi:hypothetical protein
MRMVLNVLSSVVCPSLHLWSVLLYICGLSFSTSVVCPSLHLWSVLLYNIFLYYLTNETILKKGLLTLKYVLNFSANSVRKISHSKDTKVRYDKKGILVVMYSTGHSCSILIKFKFS